MLYKRNEECNIVLYLNVVEDVKAESIELSCGSLYTVRSDRTRREGIAVLHLLPILSVKQAD